MLFNERECNSEMRETLLLNSAILSWIEDICGSPLGKHPNGLVSNSPRRRKQSYHQQERLSLFGLSSQPGPFHSGRLVEHMGWVDAIGNRQQRGQEVVDTAKGYCMTPASDRRG